jgi:hypothetical protein
MRQTILGVSMWNPRRNSPLGGRAKSLPDARVKIATRSTVVVARPRDFAPTPAVNCLTYRDARESLLGSSSRSPPSRELRPGAWDTRGQRRDSWARSRCSMRWSNCSPAGSGSSRYRSRPRRTPYGARSRRLGDASASDVRIADAQPYADARIGFKDYRLRAATPRQ